MDKIKKRWFYMLIFICITCVLTVIYLLLTRGPSLDTNAKDYETNVKRPEEWSQSRIAIPGYGDIQMVKDTNELNVGLFNPEDNPCYFVYTIILNKTNKELYQSGLIAPGKAITNVELNEKITIGEHPITIRINTYDLQDGKTEMNGSEVKTNIIAK